MEDREQERVVRDVVTSPVTVSVIAGLAAGLFTFVVWLNAGPAWAAGAAVAGGVITGLVYRLTPLVTFELRHDTLRCCTDGRCEEWPLADVVFVDLIVAVRGADSLHLQTRNGRQVLVPVTASATLSAAAPALLGEGVNQSQKARRFLLAVRPSDVT